MNVIEDDARWNHNIHYHPKILSSVPVGAECALDVGCGEGMLVRALADRVPHVVGIDTDSESIEAARRACPTSELVLDDFFAQRFASDSFDFITSIAALHHMDISAALRRMAGLLRPGGSLMVIGCARSSGPSDLPYELAGLIVHRFHTRSKQWWEHPSPQLWPPPLTYSQVRSAALRALPGSRFRRHALWRYSLQWTKALHPSAAFDTPGT